MSNKMDKLMKINKSAELAIIDFFKFLLENKRVSGIFTLRKINKDDSVDYCLVTDESRLDDVIPFYPFMPANAGQILSRFSHMNKPVAVVIKPCELRAFIELVKREQGTLDNFLLISYSCAGVFPIIKTGDEPFEKFLPDYWETVKKGGISQGIRPTCKVCEHFLPMNADITISLIGENKLDSECKMFLNTDKAKEFVKDFEGEMLEEDLESPVINSLLTKRKGEKEDLFTELSSKYSGLDGMINIFGRCIGCHGCSRVCPICYCTLCDFESQNYDYSASILEREISQKGALRLPPDTIFFHLGRLIHMSFSCIGCGLCTEVCPANIPVSTLFIKIGEETAKMFDYIPGRNVKEAIPVTVFKEEEFAELGD